MLKRSFSREEQFNDEGFSISRYIASEVNYIGEIISYKYDSNQLIKEVSGKDYICQYEYDANGNILSAKRARIQQGTSITCTYSNGDRLVSVTKNKVTYSIIYGGYGSNPTSYRGYELSWEINGLTKVENSDLIAEYSYDEANIRIKKIVNGVTTIVGLLGSVVVSESRGDNVTYYHYDGNSILIGFNYNGKEYSYLRDLIGKIILVFVFYIEL